MKRKFLAFMTATMFFMLLLSSTVLAAYQRTADNTVPAYRNSSLTQRTGNERVDKGDVVIVLQETNRAYYVRYPVRNGTKDRWVPKNIFNTASQSQQINNGHNPEGCLDSVVSNANNQITIRGWALDRDNVNEQIRVHVYIGGPAGSGEGHEIYANTYRPDVNRALAGVGEYHGFEATVNTNRTGSQSVYVYGINIGGGENKELSSSPKTVRINNPTNTHSTQITNRLQQVISEWKGKKWDNRESGRIGSTCFGFANYVFRELHGVIAGSQLDWSKPYALKNPSSGVSCTYSGYINENAWHILLQECKPGDFLQTTNGSNARQHTMIFVSYNPNTRVVRVLDANFADPPDNIVRDRSKKLSDFAHRFQYVSRYTK